MERNNLIKKGVVVVVILLFVVAFAPSINANISKASIDSELIEITTEVCASAVVTKKDDDKSETLDNGRVEIYSKISGGSTSQHYKGIVFKRQVKIYGWLDIEAHTLNPSEPVYYATTSQYLYAPLFIGVFYPIAPGAFAVSGFALGNIKWR